jgi:exoribonuclease II
MLDRQALTQLKGLKQQMESEKERAEGVIRGTSARYGFVRLDDGREVFVPPDEMLKAFPGDRVARDACGRAKDKRPVADIEAPGQQLVDGVHGSLREQGQGHVRPARRPGAVSRWLFLPPKERQGIKDR